MQNDRAGEWSATLGSRPAAGGIMFLREVLKQGFEVQIICLEGLGGWELDRQLLGSCSKERRSPGMTSYLGSESERNPPLPFSPSLHPPPPACAAQEPSLFPGQQRFPAVAAWRDLAAGRRRHTCSRLREQRPACHCHLPVGSTAHRELVQEIVSPGPNPVPRVE